MQKIIAVALILAALCATTIVHGDNFRGEVTITVTADKKASFRQDTTGDMVKIKLIASKEPLRGATLRIIGSNPPLGTTSDMNGNAELSVPKEFNTVEISFLGPYTVLKILRPVDSIYFDISSRTATYYLNKRRVKKKKQIVRGY